MWDVIRKSTGRSGVTVHGFRSAFRDWAGETTEHDYLVVETALAHTVGSAVERAYRRGDLLGKPRVLLQDWAGYCTGGGGKPTGE